MKKCIVIPTYWGEIDGREEITFDHPTLLKSEGTLRRLLMNLSEFDGIKRGRIKVIIIGVANKSAYKEEVEKLLNIYLDEFKMMMDVALYSYTWFDALKDCLYQNKIEDASLIEPLGYSQVRNLCLLAALENKVDYAIFLDDDELVITNDFFEKVEEGILGKAPDNGIIYGKVGYYLENKKKSINFYELKWWPKNELLNAAISRLINSNNRYVTSMIGLGGLMILTRELMKNVCFDPSVPRGEDIDYIFNARMLGYRVYFDKKLFIKHLPPKIKTPEWRTARSDIIRFLYERAKYKSHLEVEELQKVAFEELLPYPGTFMRDDLEERIMEYSKTMSIKYLANKDLNGFHECMENAKIPFSYTPNINAAMEYLSKIRIWTKITNLRNLQYNDPSV